MHQIITKPFVLMALLHSSKVSAVEYPEQDGHCPFNAGELSSNVKSTLNVHRLEGKWINVFDKTSLNENHKCYGVKLLHSYPYDDYNLDLKNEEHMQDVERVFEYIKATNVGLSPDMNPRENYEEPDPEPEDEDTTMLAFGYNVYHGFQLNFNHPSDKSIAYLQHRDVHFKDHESNDLKEHTHDDEKAEQFNEHVFDSQFKRYAQVLDTDYDKYMVLYQCFETAQYFERESGKRIPEYEAWDHVKSTSLNYSSWPKSSYKFDDTIEVKPRHFENVKILWRPQAKQTPTPEIDESPADEAYVNDIEPPTEYRYPEESEAHHLRDQVGELKRMIASKHPQLSWDSYGMLDHMNGRCDYDPYDRYDVEWHDEGFNFGHMYSEDIPGMTPESVYEEEEEYPEETDYGYADPDYEEPHADEGGYEPTADDYEYEEGKYLDEDEPAYDFEREEF